MNKPVFISYSSDDRLIAETICHALEKQGVACWIAPRDIPPGSNWGGTIVEAVGRSKALIFVFSNHSNHSPQVLREIERAVHKRVPVLPFRIEEVTPSPDLEYFISSCHWMDAFPPPAEQYVERIYDALRPILGGKNAGEAPVSAPASNSQASPAPAGWGAMARWKAIGVVGLILLIPLLMMWLTLWVSPPEEPAPTVALTSPEDGVVKVSPVLQLSWGHEGLETSGLSYEILLRSGGREESIRLTRNSYVPTDYEGDLEWQVRPVWRSNGEEIVGAWSEKRSLTYYRDSLSRFLQTGVLHVGTAEAGDIFVIDRDGEIGGFEIDLLKLLGADILANHEVEIPMVLRHTYAIWGDPFFELLQNPSIDVLASGISITPERESRYGLRFTNPVVEYPQTLITETGRPPLVDGQLVVRKIGAVANTTNAELAKKLLDGEETPGLVLYEGSGSYPRMLRDLIGGEVEAILMDRPYALDLVAAFGDRYPSGFLLTDVTSQDFPGMVLQPERIGLAVRRSDGALLEELNRALEQQAEEVARLLQKYLPEF